MFDLTVTLAELRAEGGDLPGVEMKSATGGLTESIISTLCSFANRPGGGMIILGLDAAAGFAPVGLTKPREMKSAIAAKARSAFEPPITIHLDQAVVDGEAVIVGTVDELDPSQKPCCVSGGQHRGAWIRAWDGDYRASELEIQGLLANRSQPRFDADPAPSARRSDLDPELVADFLRNCRLGSNQLARIHDDDELLWRMGVLVDTDRTPSVAGILALGAYPQQHLPATGLQAILAAPPSEQRTTRALDSRRFDGPIPRIIADATDWVARSSATAIVSNHQTGRVTDNPSWPGDAVRELVGNAIIDRDLAPWALGETALLRLDNERLITRNPGGLYGLDVSRLGQTGVTSARNTNLVRICQNIRLPDGTRAAEALASGIPTILRALDSAGLPKPLFYDDALRFTVVLRQRSNNGRSTTQPNTSRAKILLALNSGPLDVRELQAATGLTPPNIRKHLRQLRTDGLLTQHGGQGQRASYTRTIH
jgi:ATP-dependent DNA helicase RecG